MDSQQIFTVQNPINKGFNLGDEDNSELNPEALTSLKQASATSKDSQLGNGQNAQSELKSMQAVTSQLVENGAVNPMQSIQPTQPPADSIAPAFPGQDEYEGQDPGLNQDWVDCVNIAEESLKELLVTTRPLRFDWENKWLRGDQYAHMLNNIDGYKEAFGMPKLAEKQHPENIYLEPQNGQVYFVRANSIGSDFGFPRLGIKKKYKWKKMNFTTDLPKRNPLVSYIVASAVRCEKFFPGQNKNGGPVYRMHAVILKTNKPARGTPATAAAELEAANQKQGKGAQNPQDDLTTLNQKQLYICCHVRRVEIGLEDNDDSGGGKAATDSQQKAIMQKQVIMTSTMRNNKRSMTAEQMMPQTQQQRTNISDLLDLGADHIYRNPYKDHMPSGQTANNQYGISSQSQPMQAAMGGLLPKFSRASSSGSKNQESDQLLTGSKRPRRMAAMKVNKEDSQDPYIYTSTAKIVNRRARGAAQQAQNQSQAKGKRGAKHGEKRGPGRPPRNLAPHVDFGQRLFSGLKADISSDETGGRRRRAYTEMDDLLADDMKQNEAATSEVDMNRQRSNPFSDRNSTSKTKKQQLSEMGQDENKGRISIQLSSFLDPPVNEPGSTTLKKREQKQQDKQHSIMQQTLFKNLGPEPQASPINGPLAEKFNPMNSRKFSLDHGYNERVRNQDLKKLLKGKLQAWLTNPVSTNRLVALGLKNQTKNKLIKSNADKKEFVSPKPIGTEISRNTNEIHRNVSPMLQAHMPNIHVNMLDTSEDANQHGLRRRSSQIISADQSFKEGPQPGGRDREDSMAGFRKFEKHSMFEHMQNVHQNQKSPLLSPSLRSTPQNATPMQISNQLLSSASPCMQGLNLQSLLLQQLGAQSRFQLPGQSMMTPQFPQMTSSNFSAVNNSMSILNQLSQSPMLNPSLPKNMLNLAGSANFQPSGATPFRQANRNSFMELSANLAGPAMARSSFSAMDFGSNTEALLNSQMPRPPNMLIQGPGINELLQNQMPSHKMSIDFSSVQRQPDQK